MTSRIFKDIAVCIWRDSLLVQQTGVKYASILDVAGAAIFLKTIIYSKERKYFHSNLRSTLMCVLPFMHGIHWRTEPYSCLKK